MKNVGKIDRLIRVLLAIPLIAASFYLEGNLKFVGVLGLVFLGTAMAGVCPLYCVFGIKTCPLPKSKD